MRRRKDDSRRRPCECREDDDPVATTDARCASVVFRYIRGMSADAVLDPTEPVLPEAKMHVVMPNAPVSARIRSSRLCMKGKSASFIRHVEIDVAGTPLEGSFRAGQSFGETRRVTGNNDFLPDLFSLHLSDFPVNQASPHQ